MINLLPDIAKKKIHKEYRLRLAIVFLCTIFVLEVYAGAVYFPSYFVLNSATKRIQTEIDQKKLLTPETNEGLPAQLSVIKKRLDLLKLSDGLQDMPPSRLMGQLLENKPRGIELSAISYAETSGAVAIQMSGVAGTHEALFAFQKALKISTVESVKYNSSFVTKKPPIDFTVVVTFKKLESQKK